MWAYLKAHNVKKSKVAGNLLHVYNYRGGISYTPNVERMVEQRANCCLSVLKSLVLFQVCHGHVRKDTRLSTPAQLKCLCSGAWEPGNEASLLPPVIVVASFPGPGPILGTRLPSTSFQSQDMLYTATLNPIIFKAENNNSLRSVEVRTVKN